MVDVGTIPARDRANGVVAGVAAGIARTLEVDPTLVRLLFALLTLAGGAGILLYLAAALLMPEAAGARTSGTRTAIGLALLLLAAIAALNGLGLPGFVQVAAALAAAVEDITLALVDEALPVGENAGLPLHRFQIANTAEAHQAVQNGAVGKVLIDVS